MRIYNGTVDRYHVHFASGDEHFTSRPFVPKVA